MLIFNIDEVSARESPAKLNLYNSFPHWTVYPANFVSKNKTYVDALIIPQSNEEKWSIHSNVMHPI